MPAKKKKDKLLDNELFKSSIENLSKIYNVSKEDISKTMKKILEDEFIEIFNINEQRLDFSFDEDYNLQLNIKKDVVDEVEEELTEISEEDAKKINKEYKLDDLISLPVDFRELDRQSIKLIEEQFFNRIENIHTDIIYRKYKEKEGEIIVGTFLRFLNDTMIINLKDTEGIILKYDQSSRDYYTQGDKVKAVIKYVKYENGRLTIFLSRTDPRLIHRLFENEVTELKEGLIEIVNIVRAPGSKVKMSVKSLRDKIDATGACVGMGGIRIKQVIKELGGEKIDVITYFSNVKDYLARSLQPAKVLRVIIISEENKEALVIVEDPQLSLAIGRNGENVKLASRLTGWKIDIKTKTQIEKNPQLIEAFNKAEAFFSGVKSVDSDLYQLTDIDEGLLVKLMNAGIMTIYQLYEMSEEEIAKIEDITQEDAKNIKEVLNSMVELVDEEEAEEAQTYYGSEVEDEIKGVDTNEEIEEEVQEVEYLTCPSCGKDFEYKGENKCPHCNTEFEFED